VRRQIGRYSKYLRPITITFDLIVLVIVGLILLPLSFQSFFFYLSIALAWLIISIATKFYQVYRFTKLIQIAQKAISQYFLFGLFVFAINGLFTFTDEYREISYYLLAISILTLSVKYLVFWLLKIFRTYYGGN